MKKFALTTLLLVIVSCGGGDASMSDAEVSELIELAGATGVAGEIAKVVCEPLSSLDAKSPSDNKNSWQCKRDERNVKFDVYLTAAEKEIASKEALSLLGATGGAQTWADTPILCGDTWTMGVADLETRDALIVLLNVAGVSAATC